MTDDSPGSGLGAHQWDRLRERPTVIDNNHESLYQSYGVLEQVAVMLERGDSAATVLDFLKWCRC